MQSVRRLRSTGRLVSDPIPWDDLTEAETAQLWNGVKPFKMNGTRMPKLLEISAKVKEEADVRTEPERKKQREERRKSRKVAHISRKQKKLAADVKRTGSNLAPVKRKTTKKSVSKKKTGTD